MDVELMRTASERVHGFTSSSGLDSLITAENFGPHLFKNEHPNFIYSILFGWSREGPLLRIRVVREIVVYNYSLLLSVDVDSGCVASRCIHLVGQEDFLNSLWVFGQ